jgi:hypothetical protein
MAYCTDNGCSIILNSKCVFYESSTLPVLGINTNDSLQVALQKIEAVISGIGSSVNWGDIGGDIEDQTDLVAYVAAAVSGLGTVTSFSAGDLSPLFTTNVTNSTTTPALAFTLTNQNANVVFAGPATGIAAAPTFRALVAADIPSIDLTSGVTGILPIANGGTGSIVGAWLLAGTSTLSADVTIAGNFTKYFTGNGSVVLGHTSITGSSKFQVRGLGTTTGNLVLFEDSAGTERFKVLDSGKVGIGLTPTATLHLKAGTTAAQTAPLKLTDGSLLTTPEDGAMEYSTDKLYFTRMTGPTRGEIAVWNLAPTSGRVIFTTTNGRLNDNSLFTYSQANQALGVGLTTPTRTIHARQSDTVDNAVVPTLILDHTLTAGSLTNGMGTGIEFKLANLTGAAFSAVYTDVTAASEDIKFVWSLTAAGAAYASKMELSSTGNLWVSGNIGVNTNTFGTNAVGVLCIKNGTIPSSSPADSIQLYAEDIAASSELKVRDEAGNITTLSPHNFSLIGKASEEMAWAYYSEKNGKKINVDMLKLARVLEQISGEKLVYIQ